jgi:hypothetical protein
MTQGTFGVIQGTSGVIQGTFGMIQGTFGVIQGAFGVIQGTFTSLGCAGRTPLPSITSSLFFSVKTMSPDLIQGTFGMIQ